MTTFQDHLPEFAPLPIATREWVARVKNFSMLHAKTLEALYQLASVSEGAILEIGPYVGGSTTVMARALKDAASRRRLITVEVGGAYPTHPQIPSKDILADLEANLRGAGVRERVEIVAGVSFNYLLIRQVQESLGGQPVGLLVIDSNGLVRTDFTNWGPCCRVPCYLVIDDYVQEENNGRLNKSQSIYPVIEELTREGYLQRLAVLPWGTWFGKIVKPLRFSPTTEIAPFTWRLNPPFTPVGKVGWVTSLGLDDMPKIHEKLTGPTPLALKIFEGTRPLGPAGGSLADVRERGRGFFSHAADKHFTLLTFSTSDNSDPNTNGREYMLRVAA